VGRWAEDANGRLRAAAMQLYVERGFDDTTVADIAAKAGVTARTFFRHFADKREVLFDGSERLQQLMVESLSEAPADASPLDAVAAALIKAGDFFDDERRPFARLRSRVIAAHPDLHERELIKLARLSAALAAALRGRGIDEPDASLAAEAGIAVFRIAFMQWVAESEARGYAEIVNQSLARLKALAAD